MEPSAGIGRPQGGKLRDVVRLPVVKLGRPEYRNFPVGLLAKLQWKRPHSRVFRPPTRRLQLYAEHWRVVLAIVAADAAKKVVHLGRNGTAESRRRRVRKGPAVRVPHPRAPRVGRRAKLAAKLVQRAHGAHAPRAGANVVRGAAGEHVVPAIRDGARRSSADAEAHERVLVVLRGRRVRGIVKGAAKVVPPAPKGGRGAWSVVGALSAGDARAAGFAHVAFHKFATPPTERVVRVLVVAVRCAREIVVGRERQNRWRARRRRSGRRLGRGWREAITQPLVDANVRPPIASHVFALVIPDVAKSRGAGHEPHAHIGRKAAAVEGGKMFPMRRVVRGHRRWMGVRARSHGRGVVGQGGQAVFVGVHEHGDLVGIGEGIRPRLGHSHKLKRVRRLGRGLIAREAVRHARSCARVSAGAPVPARSKRWRRRRRRGNHRAHWEVFGHPRV